MEKILKGKPVADAIKADTAKRAENLKKRGVMPVLTIVRAGERDDDIAYERRIEKNCSQAGIEVRKKVYPREVSQAEFVAALRSLSEDDTVHGILVLRPLPPQLDEDAAASAIDPAKDVDCMNSENLRKIFTGDPLAIPPCTSEAVVEILKYYGVALEGKNVVIANRSLVLGRPLAMLLLNENATVTICHSHTRDLVRTASQADIFVTGIGKARHFGKEYVSPKTVVIDAGINFSEHGMCGDMKYEEAAETAAAITPVPGGVGGVTSALLLRHLVKSAELSIES